MPQIVTAIDAVVAVDREQELLAGFAAINAETEPDGLVRSELLRGQDGRWRIQTTWRDFDALMAVRDSGEPPAALRLLESIGAAHSHAVFVVEQRHGG
jgi:hypothetical protein